MKIRPWLMEMPDGTTLISINTDISLESSINKKLEVFCSVDYISDISLCLRFAHMHEYRRDSDTGVSWKYPPKMELEVHLLLVMNCLQRAFFQD
jgi:hypothetical protein